MAPMTPRPTAPPPRIQIERPEPRVACGRHPAKRTVGDVVRVAADVYRDGHDVLRAVVRSRPAGSRRWAEAPMLRVDADEGGDRWEGSFVVDRPGRWEFTIAAWTDAFASWRTELERKVEAGQEDLAGEVSEGAVLLREAAERATGPDRDLIAAAAAAVAGTGSMRVREAAGLDPDLLAAVCRHPDRSAATSLGQPLRLDVDRERARFGCWYELFPRSWGGLRGVAAVVPELAALGVDVLYLPPIHPIGRTNRKGANNALVARKRDPGSPWAVGDATGGHTAIHADLGDFGDFAALVAACESAGIDLALDFAIQCSADHPWLTQHPEWFHHRPDGSLKYAENPPKKYQDIYNVNFDSDDWRGLWDALRDVVLFWVGKGVRVFRVDNPHTKPFPFWEWLIAEVRREHPDVLFLAEAFTRWAPMRGLAELGFSQSYTYFTWKNTRWEIEQFVELMLGARDLLRPNLFVNTPDILTEYLQHGGPPAFHARLVLGATLGPAYGIYSGFEHFENVAVRAGSEEYLDSEKYETKQRSLDGPLLPRVRRLNEIRRAHPALQHLEEVTFLESHNEAIVAYLRRFGTDAVIVVVNIDPQFTQEGLCDVPHELALPPVFGVTDELNGGTYEWRLGGNYVRLEPGGAHVLAVAP
jgi:starch synthase (maltosyl-transferring)